MNTENLANMKTDHRLRQSIQDYCDILKHRFVTLLDILYYTWEHEVTI